MAAYAVTTTLDVPKVDKALRMGVLRGQANVTNYNQTRAEITAITKRFKSAPTVILSGASSTGILGYWDPSGKSIKCYVGSTGAESANDTVGGIFGFVAIGPL